MDTELLITESKSSLEELKNNINYLSSGNPGYLDVLNLVMLSKSLQEIYQLIEIFKFNLERLKKEYSSKNFIAINACTTNFLCSAKSLLDYMETFIKNDLEFSEEEANNKYKLIFSSEYDRLFAYRFLYKLRDYTQHGCLAVSCAGEEPCIDVVQIYNTKHYRYNNKIKEEIMAYEKKTMALDGNVFKLSLAPLVVEYSCSIYSVFIKVLDEAKPKLNNLYRIVMNVIKADNSLINHVHYPEYRDCLFYENVNSCADIDVLLMNENPVDEFVKYKEKIEKWLKIENDTYKEMKKCFQYIY